MTYSCTDFTDDILDALHVNVPEEDLDNTIAQADLAVEAIRSLQDGAAKAARLLPSTRRQPVREYLVEIKATNSTILQCARWHAKNRAHAVALALLELGDRRDIASIKVEKISEEK